MATNFMERYDRLNPARKARVDARAEQMIAEMPLAELRVAFDKSQRELAGEMGITQAQVSRLEKQADAYVSTLRRYIESMGGKLTIMADFLSGSFEITQFGETAETLTTQRAAVDLRFSRAKKPPSLEKDSNITC